MLTSFAVPVNLSLLYFKINNISISNNFYISIFNISVEIVLFFGLCWLNLKTREKVSKISHFCHLSFAIKLYHQALYFLSVLQGPRRGRGW